MRIKKLKKYFTPANLTVLTLVVVAFVLRIYRIDQLLGFYYDQGRDALVIWDLIHSYKLFLIGPTTGIAGIFRGPFYYYLIAPFYFLGNGNPLWPEVFLILTSVIALLVMYFLAKKVGGTLAGIVSLVLGVFSYEIIYASRWLSNPTPMLLLSMILVALLFGINEGKKKLWIGVGFVLGLSLFHFGSSGELFYLFGVLIFAIWHFIFSKTSKKNIPEPKVLLFSLGAFFVSYLPLLLFDLKHQWLLTNNIKSFLFANKSFGGVTALFLADRLKDLTGFFTALLFHSPVAKDNLWMLALFVILIYNLPVLLKNDKVKILFILLVSPILGLLFFQGNFGNIYGYYLTGYFLIFLLFVGISLAHIFNKSTLGKIFVVVFLVAFLSKNWFWTKGMLNTVVTDPVIIVLGNQKMAIDWIYTEADGREFNVDVYVPPVISYSYDYLFKWYPVALETENEINLIEDRQTPLLYTLYEIDPEHPDRLDAWLERQAGIGKVLKEKRFGGVIVQERERI